MTRHSPRVLVLRIGLTLTGCSDLGDAMSPALASLHQRAASGDASTQLDFGLRSVTGTGITPDERAALCWIDQAATQDSAAARFELITPAWSAPNSRTQRLTSRPAHPEHLWRVPA